MFYILRVIYGFAKKLNFIPLIKLKCKIIKYRKPNSTMKL